MAQTPIFGFAMPALHQHLMPARDHALDKAGLDLLDRIQQADMRGDVNDAQFR